MVKSNIKQKKKGNGKTFNILPPPVVLFIAALLISSFVTSAFMSPAASATAEERYNSNQRVDLSGYQTKFSSSPSSSFFNLWTNWKSEGGKFISNVDAKLVRYSVLGSIVDTYAIGTDNTLQRKFQVFEGDSGPYASENLGHGFLKSTPDFIMTLNGVREFFAVGTDQQLWFLRDGNPNWVSLGGNIIGNPDVIMDVFQSAKIRCRQSA